MDEVIESARLFAHGALATYDPGHDPSHAERVLRLSLFISDREGGDRTVIALASLLHDVGDHKFTNGHEMAGRRAIQHWMEQQKLAEPIREGVLAVISRMGYRGPDSIEQPHSVEHAIVQDADRLDAIGAIGIARAFSFGAFEKRSFFDPRVLPKTSMNADEYRSHRTSSLNHFFEKLLHLKGQMLTDTGRQMAERRHRMLQEYLRSFLDEWFLGDVPRPWQELLEIH
ncbi:MAG: HD domain-containing protein [Bdellovibrionota bacterium]|nr:MAG: HD domain-containing protein [Bdellovibrionota bacterium]